MLDQSRRFSIAGRSPRKMEMGATRTFSPEGRCHLVISIGSVPVLRKGIGVIRPQCKFIGFVKLARSWQPRGRHDRYSITKINRVRRSRC